MSHSNLFNIITLQTYWKRTISEPAIILISFAQRMQVNKVRLIYDRFNDPCPIENVSLYVFYCDYVHVLQPELINVPQNDCKLLAWFLSNCVLCAICDIKKTSDMYRLLLSYLKIYLREKFVQNSILQKMANQRLLDYKRDI